MEIGKSRVSVIDSITGDQNKVVLKAWLDDEKDLNSVAKRAKVKLSAVLNRFKDIEYMIGETNTLRNVPKGFYEDGIEFGLSIVNLPTWVYARKYIDQNKVNVKYKD